MNPYNLALLFFAFSSLLTSSIPWLKKRDELGWIYLLWSISVAGWAVNFSIVLNQNVDYQTALLCSRMAHGSAIFIGITWYHLTLAFIGNSLKHRRRLIFLYVLSGIEFCFIGTSWFIPRVEPILGFAYYTRTGPILDFAIIVFLIETFLGFKDLIFAIRHTDVEPEKARLKQFLFANVIAYTGGLLTLLPIYKIAIPQYALFLMPLYPFAMVYFMIRRNLFDIETIAQAFQREKLATMGLLAASINHEIRNPLYAMKGLLETYLENKREGLQGKNPEEVSEKALAQLNRALEVIGKLNRFAKPASEGSGQTASIPEAVQTVLDLVSAEFKLDRILIQNEIPGDLPKIQADQRQLEEILFNLIVNACQAMKGGGTLTIQAEKGTGNKHVILRQKAEESMHRSFAGAQDDTVVVTITDTGIGISPDQAKHLFEPFHTTKGEKGTGLGLYITKQLIERNGGKISAQTKPGQGTLFMLEFKRA